MKLSNKIKTALTAAALTIGGYFTFSGGEAEITVNGDQVEIKDVFVDGHTAVTIKGI